MATTAFQKWRTEWQAFRKSLLPEASDEPLKAGDWVVTPEGIGFITRVDASFTDGTTTDPLPFRVKFNKGHTLCYASGELRRARPDEIPQPVNINACDESDTEWEVFENPPPKFVIQEGDEWTTRNGRWERFRKHRIGRPFSEFCEVQNIYSIRRRRKPAPLTYDHDCVPEASDEPLKEGDWVVCVNARGCDLVYGCKYEVTSTYSDGGDFLVLKGFTANYHASRFRRARPDEIPQPVNINACDNPSGPCACGAWHNESDKPCDGDSFTPGKPVEQAQPLQLREGAWYRRRDGKVVGNGFYSHDGFRMSWWFKLGGESAKSYNHDGTEVDGDGRFDLIAEVPAPSEPTTEQLTDEQVSAELKSAGIDMQPAFERLHKMFDEHKQKQPDADGWIEWHGGEMPVDGEQLVSRRCLDVSIPSGPYLASSLRWTHVGNRYDITHYRLVQPAPKYRPFASAAEFSPHRDRWLRYKHNESGTAGRASWTTASGIEIGKHSFGWTTLFHDYVFDDNGQPCGIEVK